MNFRGSLSAPSVQPSPSTPDDFIDPALFDHDDITTPSSPTPSSTNHLPFSSTASTPSASTISTPSTSVHSRTPSLSGQAKLDAAISKAKSSISHVGKKRTLDQSFMLMQQ